MSFGAISHLLVTISRYTLPPYSQSCPHDEKIYVESISYVYKKTIKVVEEVSPVRMRNLTSECGQRKVYQKSASECALTRS